MVNVQRAHDVVFDSVRFAENRRSDDTFHALHADITLTHSVFADANGDAVDLDLSTGQIPTTSSKAVGVMPSTS